jgi:hypothetical protein
MVKWCRISLFAAWIYAFSCNKPLKMLYMRLPEPGIRSDNRYLAFPEHKKAVDSNIRRRNGFAISLRLRGGGKNDAGSLASPVLREHFTRGHFHHGSLDAVAKQVGATQAPSVENEVKIPVKRASRKTSDSDMDMENQPWFHHAANDEGHFQLHLCKQKTVKYT